MEAWSKVVSRICSECFPFVHWMSFRKLIVVLIVAYCRGVLETDRCIDWRWLLGFGFVVLRLESCCCECRLFLTQIYYSIKLVDFLSFSYTGLHGLSFFLVFAFACIAHFSPSLLTILGVASGLVHGQLFPLRRTVFSWNIFYKYWGMK
jgi:hypothetical protein